MLVDFHTGQQISARSLLKEEIAGIGMVSMMIPSRNRHILNYIRDGINGAVFFLYLEDMVRIVDVNCGILREQMVYFIRLCFEQISFGMNFFLI